MFHKDDRVDPALLGEVPFFADFDQGRILSSSTSISTMGFSKSNGLAFIGSFRCGLSPAPSYGVV